MTEKTYPEWRPWPPMLRLPTAVLNGAIARRGDAVFAKRNPATGAVLGQVARGRAVDDRPAVRAARTASRIGAGAASPWPSGGTFC